MTAFTSHKIGQTRLPVRTADPAQGPAQRSSAVLVPFPGPDARRTRRLPPSDAERGEILFFLGVRYERLAS